MEKAPVACSISLPTHIKREANTQKRVRLQAKARRKYRDKPKAYERQCDRTKRGHSRRLLHFSPRFSIILFSNTTYFSNIIKGSEHAKAGLTTSESETKVSRLALPMSASATERREVIPRALSISLPSL